MTPSPQVLRIRAAGVLDAGGSRGPSTVLLEQSGRVLAIGSDQDVARHEASAGATLLERSGDILMPALVNAHVHLDLTSVGPVAHDPANGFAGWVLSALRCKPVEADAIAASVERGVELTRLGGVAAVGDIGGSSKGQIRTEAFEALQGSRLAGVHFPEFFGIGLLEDNARAQLRAFEETATGLASAGVALGLSPHATTSVAPALFLEAVECAARLADATGAAVPVCAHVAEHAAERAFIARAEGPMREFAGMLSFWDDRMLEDLGKGLSPVQHCAPWLRRACELGVPVLLAHVLDVDDRDLDTLAETRARVVYCPRSTRYFANDAEQPHRFKQMRERGIGVCLGTDSIVNLGFDRRIADTAGRISPLDDARALLAEGAADEVTLVEMMTTAGAAALGLDTARFTLGEGDAPAGVIAVPGGLKSSEPAPIAWL